MSGLGYWLPPIISLLGGPAFAGIVIAWWKHQERKRSQTDNVALSLVDQLRHRIDVLETWVKDLQGRLGNAEAEKKGLFWLLKFCPEERRAEAIADVERQMRDDEERRIARDADPSLQSEVRAAAQVIRSAGHVVADKMAAE